MKQITLTFNIPDDKHKDYCKLTDEYLNNLDSLGEEIKKSIKIFEVKVE